jgi:hypothetical protein
VDGIRGWYVGFENGLSISVVMGAAQVPHT